MAPCGIRTLWLNRKPQTDPFQLLVTHHSDFTVRFADYSKHLRASNAPLRFEYPQPLPHLRIDVANILDDPSLVGLVDQDSHLTITSVHLSSNGAHCAVVLSTGCTVFFSFGEKGGSTFIVGEGDNLDLDLDEEQSIVVVLTDLARDRKRQDGYWPRCLLDSRYGQVSVIALSDQGETELVSNIHSQSP